MNTNKKPWNTKRYDEKRGGYEFLLGGRKVHKLGLGAGRVKISLWDDFFTIISFGMNFDFVQHGKTQQLAARNVVSLSPLLQLVDSEIESVVADKSGFLNLRFSNQIHIQAPNDASEFRFEAWEISDGHGFHVVCAIGGSVSIWDPHSQKLFDF